MPKYFFHNSITNRIVLFVSFSGTLLLVYMNTTKLEYLLFILQTCWVNIYDKDFFGVLLLELGGTASMEEQSHVD